jgi:predicted HTH transcriptional regulator
VIATGFTSLPTVPLSHNFKIRSKTRSGQRLRVPEKRLLVTPAVEAQLNERQREILDYLLTEGAVTNRWCRARFSVVYNTAYRDLQSLVDLGLIEPIGSGRNVKYIQKGSHG